MSGIKVVKRSRNKFRDLKRTKLIYLTYVLTFPDGDQWTKQRAMSAHDMAFELQQIINEHKREKTEWKTRMLALFNAGECWWKDEAGVEHLMLIEDQKREDRWGLSQSGFGTIRQETDAETKKHEVS